MSESRGAASVTLDTIITEALLAYYDVIPLDDQDGIADIQAAAVAVTDALLAKGELLEGPEEYYVPRGEVALFISLKATS